MKKFYVYRYKDVSSNIIYVGKTLRPLKERVNEHKVEELWKHTDSIEFITTDNEADMICHERYYINLWKPKFNIAEMKDGIPKMTPYPYEWNLYWKKNDSKPCVSVDLQMLEKVFDIFNKELFDDKIPKQRIMVSHSGQKLFGYFGGNGVVYENSGQIQYCIDVPEEYLYQDIEKALMQILVSMIDIHCGIIGKEKLSSRKYRYRPKRFAKLAENYGLKIEKDSTYGYKVVGLEDQTWELCDGLKISDLNIYRKNQLTHDGKKPSSTRKYICPCCGNSFRATKDVKVMCMDCNEQYIKEK